MRTKTIVAGAFVGAAAVAMAWAANESPKGDKSAFLAGIAGTPGVPGTKVCSIFHPGNFRDSLNVSNAFTERACQDLMRNEGGTVFQLACLHDEGVAFGTPDGGRPVPNCGW